MVLLLVVVTQMLNFLQLVADIEKKMQMQFKKWVYYRKCFLVISIQK